MPQPRHYADHAARQAAYRARQAQARLAEQPAQGLPPLAPRANPPSRARWQALLTQAQWSLQTLCDEVQTYADARSDAWQESERAALLAEQLDGLVDALAALDAVPPFVAPRRPPP